MLKNLLGSIFGTRNDRLISNYKKLVTQINALEDKVKKLKDNDFKNKTEEFKERIKKGESLEKMLVEVFAHVREAGVRSLGMRHFDEQLIGVKKGETKIIEAVMPENHPKKELANKKTKFECKILNVKQSKENKIDDNFAKNLRDKDLNDLKTLISKQINDEYKNSLDQLAKNQILKEIEKIKVDEVPENLIEEEVKILSQGMDDNEAKKNKAKFTETAKNRIKTGLILNEFGEQNKIQVTEKEIQAEVQKQLRMMPGQEKMVMDFYQKNPSAVASLRGTVYEEKILNLIKEKAKPNKKEISKEEAEKILKEAHKHDHNHDHDHDHEKDKKKKETKKKSETKSEVKKKPSAKASKSKPAPKKVSKK